MNTQDKFPAFDREPAAPDDGEPSLPPVQPPSAGFIVQLFLVPAIIVAAVVGVYLLFGQLATGELDWRQQIQDVRSENPHVRWRAALNLAQMLDADAEHGESDQPLAANTEVAETLTELFDETRNAPLRDEETQRQLEFLGKALGRLDRGDLVFPSLLDTAKSDRDVEIRKYALNAIAMIVGRAFEKEDPIDDPKLVAAMIELVESGDMLSRHQAVFILGLVDATEAQETLNSLLTDADLMTRVNAAIGLARRDSTAGLPVFEDVLRDATERPLGAGGGDQDVAVFERTVMVANCIRAIDRLGPQLSIQERTRLADSLGKLAAASRDERVRIDAQDLSLRFSQAGD